MTYATLLKTGMALCALAISAITLDTSAARAEDYPAVLNNRCLTCHGAGGHAFGRFNMNQTPEELVQAGLIDLDHPENSLLYQRPAKGEMPPASPDRPKLSDDELKQIRNWIAGIKSTAPAPLSDAPLSQEQIYQKIREALAKTSPGVSDTLRFFTVGEDLGAGDGKALTIRQALSRGVNSLSWKKKLVVPQAVGGSSMLLSVNIKDLGWDPLDWQAIFGDICREKLASGQRIPSDIDRDGSCTVVPVGQFLAHALTPAAYETFIGRGFLGNAADQAPEALQEVGKIGATILRESPLSLDQLGIPTVGFVDSGVTLGNRILSRAPTAYGFLWGSRDYFDRGEASNLSVHPDAPADAGEYIYSLPNGMQAYFILNADGQVITAADRHIARDPYRADHTVTSPASCISCHGNLGINARSETDAIRNGFSAFADMKPWFDRDGAQYQKALKAAGAFRTDSLEPVTAVLQHAIHSDYLIERSR